MPALSHIIFPVFASTTKPVQAPAKSQVTSFLGNMHQARGTRIFGIVQEPIKFAVAGALGHLRNDVTLGGDVT